MDSIHLPVHYSSKVSYYMKTKIFIIFLLLSFLPSTLFADKPLEIGVILALYGDAAGLGTSLKNGIEMGLKELSLEDRVKLTFTFEDDGVAF